MQRAPGRRVALGNERARNRAGAGIEILVRAPAREIRGPFVQMQTDVADRVREIETDGNTVHASQLTDSLHVQHLTRVVLHAGQKQQRDAVAMFYQKTLEVFDKQFAVTAAWSPFDNAVIGIEPGKCHLRCRGISIRRERLFLDDNAEALGR